MSLRDDLNFGLAAFGVQIPDSLPIDQLAGRLGILPSRNVTIVVAVSSVLFYHAEKGKNARVNDIFDAMVFCSTCLSVGYSQIFAVTPAGKIIATILMTWGPALASRSLDGPKMPSSEDSQQEDNVLMMLKQILSRLEPGENPGVDSGKRP